MNYSTQQPLYLSIILINFFYKKPKEKKTDPQPKKENDRKKPNSNNSKNRNKRKALRYSFGDSLFAAWPIICDRPPPMTS